MIEARRFPRGCVCSPHYLASGAGLAVLADGGNALDAAVATNLALGVVLPYLCGYGGDLFAIVYDGDVHAYNGSGRAPAGATVEAVRERVGGDALPRVGPFTVTVPGAVEAWHTLLDRFGTRSFADLAQTALGYARDGFPLTHKGGEIISFSKDAYREPWGDAWRDVYGDAAPLQTLHQPDLARTIAAICAGGPDAYYRGEIADAIATTLQGHGALMTTDDLASHTGEWVDPLRTTYRGVEILELPPNTQGVAALEALNIVEDLDPAPRDEHLLIEAMKLALTDRDRYVTDPEQMTIDPAVLASKAWADERRRELDHERASSPVPGRAAVGGTIYLCTADERGMLVSLIQSNYMGFGSGVTVPGLGINLQNRGAYFSLDPGHANVIAPRKRTMHTLMPAMAFRDGRPWLAFGSMGGDGQPQTHLQVLTRMIDDGDDPQQAIEAPRWVVSPTDWSVAAETRFADEVLDDLRARGHDVQLRGPYATQMGHAHAIEVTDTGYATGTDPRAEGAALGL